MKDRFGSWRGRIQNSGVFWQVVHTTPKCIFGKKLIISGRGLKIMLYIHRRVLWRLIIVNSIAWAPHAYGLILVAGSSDGRVSILSYKG